MEEVEVWLAKDVDDELYMHLEKPIKNSEGYWESKGRQSYIDNDIFPDIMRDDKEPTKAKITLIK